jgi:hypothetical protein
VRFAAAALRSAGRTNGSGKRRAPYDPAMASRRTPASFSLSPLHGGRRARRRRAGALRPALLALSLAACAVVVLALALATRL